MRRRCTICGERRPHFHFRSQVAGRERTHRYGVRWMPAWPHISLGISAHIDRKFGHLSLHLPFGVLVLGFIGEDKSAIEDAYTAGYRQSVEDNHG